MESQTDGNESSSHSRAICGSCLGRIRRFIPVDFIKEMVELSKLAVPVFMAQVMSFLMGFVSTVFCGHLGKTELAGVALATAVINVTGLSIGFGLSSTCDTLISQTFGSGNLLKVGVILQRAILIVLLACFPCWSILINTESILLAVKQSPEVARVAQLYVKIFMPALPAAFMYQIQSKYLQNQGIIWPEVITGAVGNILNVIINYVCLFALNLGIAGSAVANTISQFSMAALLYSYIMWRGLHKATWGGWSKDCLQEWGAFIKLAIPSMLMLCVEWWTYEIGGFLAGLISEVELDAQSIILEVSSIAYLFPLGYSIAGSVRVGNALGAGNTEQAKLSAKLAVFCAGSVSVCLTVIVGSTKNIISYMFSNDEEIRARVADVMTLYTPFLILEALTCASGGIIRGAGKQKVGAGVYIAGYYGIGLPVGVSLMFAAKLGILGLWIGFFTCACLQSTILLFYLYKINWKAVTKEAQDRAGIKVNHQDLGSDGSVVGQPEQVGPYQINRDTSLTESDNELVVTVAGGMLSDKALVLRRGLTLAGMLSFLAAGIITNLLISNFIHGA
ncbi:multidrug and toxin extrusion protein 1 [Osmerus mordax]|uniref:multidrug and toxin extrusion protein 1 n=1 Tax=Osmerus mordax TaxID=8014 RepID=UPI00350F95B9